jgi:predicted transposase/invertase (TIGR01784 family)
MGVKRAAGFIRQMNADDRMKEIAGLHEKAKMAEYSALKMSRNEGRQEGIREGILKTAKQFLSLGLSPEQVEAATGLPLSEILELQKSK